MKPAWKYIALIGIIVVTGIWTWYRFKANSAPAAAGFHVICTNPDCGHDFVIPRDEAKTYPRDPQARAFRCERCGRFTARTATLCPTCGRWYSSQADGERSGRCPYCNPSEKPASP